MNDTAMKRILKSIAAEAIPPEEIDLWPSISKRLLPSPSCSSRRRGVMRLRFAAALLLVLGVLIISLLVVGPDRALAALRGLIGYIPGIGLVDESSELRVLSDPVSMERDGVSLTIEDGAADPQQTIILFTVEGIPAEAYTRDENDPGCRSEPSLRLPDGSILKPGRGQAGGWGSGYQARMTFDPLPGDVNDAVFNLNCIDGTRPGAAPENWQLALQFEPAPADLTIAPVLEIAPTPESTEASQASSEMGLHLDRVIELPEDFILVGEFRQGDELPNAIVHGLSEWPEITDSQGRLLPFETPSDLDLVSTEMGNFPWAYQVPKGFASPLTITFQAVDVEHMVDSGFQFDAGSDPSPGQIWSLDQSMEVAGFSVHLIKATRQESGYEFTFEADPAVNFVSVTDSIHQPISGSGGGQGGKFTVAFEYAQPVPSGMLEYRIRGLIARHEGPWTLTWAAPEGSETAPVRATPQVCLAAEGWQQAVNGTSLLPDGLMGKMIAYGRIREDGEALSPSNAGIFVANLEDGSRQILGPGTWPSLSPDGTRAAYSGTDGLRIVDLGSGTNRTLPGTTDYDYNPRWSPDGMQLAFVRIDDLNLYIVNADGTGMRRVTEGPEYEQLIGWLPDGERLAYVTPGPEGLRLHFMNTETGEQLDGFVIDSKGANIAISPDGQQITFLERVDGSIDYGLYVSALDGSNRKLIAQIGHSSVSDPRWSPDGAWVSLGISIADQHDSGPATAVINPATCEVAHLSGIDGYVQGWSR